MGSNRFWTGSLAGVLDPRTRCPREARHTTLKERVSPGIRAARATASCGVLALRLARERASLCFAGGLGRCRGHTVEGQGVVRRVIPTQPRAELSKDVVRVAR